MTKKAINTYIPDYLVTPGEVLKEYLESYGMTQSELADRMGMTKKTITEIINGKSSITPDTSLKLERVLGRPAHFWSNLERDYQEDLARLAQASRMESYLTWLKKVPVNSMVKLGWLRKHTDKKEQLDAVLSFFGVTSPEQWETVWKEHQCACAYRQTQRFETIEEAVSAWLRKGEIEARNIECSKYSKNVFQNVLGDVRALTREVRPDVFIPNLTKLCAGAGVAVVFIPELPKTGVSGATRWLADKAVIQLSLRYKSNDHLWFTFFHEAGHILLHGKKAVFIEGKDGEDPREEQANQFASKTLIPPAEYRKFVATWDKRSINAISRFAKEINIASGIVVGRLQHEGLLDRSYGNKLKVYYKWQHQ